MASLRHDRWFELLLVVFGVAAAAFLGFLYVGYQDARLWPTLRTPMIACGVVALGLLIVILVVIVRSPSQEQPPLPLVTTYQPMPEQLMLAAKLESLLYEGEQFGSKSSREEFDAWRERVIDALPMNKRGGFRELPSGGWSTDVLRAQWFIHSAPSIGYLEAVICDLRGEDVGEEDA